MELTKEHLATLTRNFCGFHDAVVSAVSVTIVRGMHNCAVKVLAQRSDDSGMWDAVEFHFHDVSAYRFEYGKRTYEVLSEGIQAFWNQSGLLVVFDVADAATAEVPALESNIAFVRAQRCSVSIEPYRL